MVHVVMGKKMRKVLSPVRISSIQPDLEVIYLGIWALPEGDVLKLMEGTKEVIPYHYDDVCLLESDFYKGKRLCDFFSRELADALNAVNNVQITDKEWHVYTGRWLENFIHIYLDRYRSIKFSSENYAIDSCYCAKGEIIPSQTDFDFPTVGSEHTAKASNFCLAPHTHSLIVCDNRLSEGSSTSVV